MRGRKSARSTRKCYAVERKIAAKEARNGCFLFYTVSLSEYFKCRKVCGSVMKRLFGTMKGLPPV